MRPHILDLALLACIISALINISPACQAKGGKNLYLKEDENNPIASITNVSISPNGKHILISDQASGSIFLYSLLDGACTRIYLPTVDLSDSIARVSIPYDSSHRFLRFSEITDSGQLSRFDPSPNSLSNAAFISDSEIVITALLHALEVPKNRKVINWDTSILMGVHCAALYCNVKSNAMKVVDLKPNGTTFPQIYVLQPIRNEHKILVSVRNWDAADSGNFARMYTLGIYDTIGNCEKDFMLLPQEISKTHIEYRLNYVYVCAESEDNMRFMDQLIPKVYDPVNGKEFDLTIPKGITNKPFLDTVKMLYEQGKDHDMPWSELTSRIHYSANHIDTYNKKEYSVVSTIYDPPLGYKFTWLFQVYDADGEMIKHQEMTSSAKTGPIRFACYSEADKSLLVFRLSPKSGWYITFYPW